MQNANSSTHPYHGKPASGRHVCYFSMQRVHNESIPVALNLKILWSACRLVPVLKITQCVLTAYENFLLYLILQPFTRSAL